MIFELGSRLVRVQSKWAPRHGDVIVVRCYSSRRTAMVFCGGSIQLTRSMRLLPTAPTWIAAISYRSRHSANAAQSSFVLPSAEQSESWPQLGERLRIRRYTWPSRGHSSAGRALPWHGRGRRFDPGWLHCLASERRRRVRPAEHAASDRTSAWLRRKDRGAPVAQSPAGKRRERGPRGDGAGPLLPGRVRLAGGLRTVVFADMSEEDVVADA